MPDIPELKPLLIKHLVEVETNRAVFLETLFAADDDQNRAEVEKLFSAYLTWLEDLVLHFDPPADGQLPAVLIGTIVELEDLNNQDRLTLRLINPFCLDILPEDISFLSEPGKQLLMKKVGDIVTLQIHSTTKLWRISAVKPDYQELGSPFLCPG